MALLYNESFYEYLSIRLNKSITSCYFYINIVTDFSDYYEDLVYCGEEGLCNLENNCPSFNEVCYLNYKLNKFIKHNSTDVYTIDLINEITQYAIDYICEHCNNKCNI